MRLSKGGTIGVSVAGGVIALGVLAYWVISCAVWYDEHRKRVRERSGDGRRNTLPRWAREALENAARSVQPPAGISVPPPVHTPVQPPRSPPSPSSSSNGNNAVGQGRGVESPTQRDQRPEMISPPPLVASSSAQAADAGAGSGKELPALPPKQEDAGPATLH